MPVYQLNQIFLKMNCFNCILNILREYKTTKQNEKINELTADQADDKSGEWMMLHCECITGSSFDGIVKEGIQEIETLP